jgi:hypothetical protein
MYLIHMSGTGKSEIRISKIETNLNDRNINDQNVKPHYQTVFVLNFEHSNFEFVSDFVLRISDFNLNLQPTIHFFSPHLVAVVRTGSPVRFSDSERSF